jgi:hypothetical protein
VVARNLWSGCALAAAVTVGIFGVVRGTFAVGGSDSSCYALMADAFAHGKLQPEFPLAARAPWPDAPRTFAPAGFIPSPVRPAAASPICAPGFSVLLVPFRWIGGRDGIFLLTPIAAGVLVWCAFVAARHLAGPMAGALASVLVASSPIVLFQAVQPMNDVATAALWMAVTAAATLDERRRWWVMGALTGMAVLVRPNLAPLAIVVALSVLGRGLFVFSMAAAPGVLATAVLNWMLYGHPARLGYGTVQDLFGVQHVATNFAHYGRTFFETHTPFALLALAAPFVVPHDRRPVVWLGLGLSIVTIGIYLLYQPFGEWWYLRFFLPAIAIATTIAAAAAVALLRRPIVVAIAGAALVAFGLYIAMSRQALDLERLESRFRHTSDYTRAKLPANAVFFTVFESGSVRFHAQREAVLWDALDPAWLDRAIDWTRGQGLEPFILVERWEEPAFRDRFDEHSAIGGLDWPPRADIDRQVRIYAPADRAAYFAGRPVPTDYVWP